MEETKSKLRLIFVPFLIICFGFTIIYSFLHWLIFIKGESTLFTDDIRMFFLPFILVWIPILIWLRRRIHLLEFKNDNAWFGYQMIAAFVMAAPAIIAVHYLETATGEITKLNNIFNIENVPKTKYYSISNLDVEKKKVAWYSTASVSGKRNEKLTYSIIAVMPIADQGELTTNAKKYWLGKIYRKSIRNEGTIENKSSQFEAFAQEVEKEFDMTDFEKFSYLELLGNNDEHQEFNSALEGRSKGLSKVSLVFKSYDEPFKERNGSKFQWIFISMAIGAAVFFLMLVFPSIEKDKLEKFRNGTLRKDDTLIGYFDFLIPKAGYYITPIIMDLNILIFLLMVLSGLGFLSFDSRDLIEWGANYGPLTTNGQWWRLVTSVFLHGGVMHILSNMIGIVFAGVLLEPLLGWKKYLLGYFLSGVLASCTSLVVHADVVSVGASGAIFGLYGILIALLLFKAIPKSGGKPVLIAAALFVGYNLVMGLAAGVDNAAHIGGLVSGFIFGCSIRSAVKKRMIEENKFST